MDCIPESPATELALMFHAEKMSVKRFRLINNAEENNVDLRVVCRRKDTQTYQKTQIE